MLFEVIILLTVAHLFQLKVIHLITYKTYKIRPVVLLLVWSHRCLKYTRSC